MTQVWNWMNAGIVAPARRFMCGHCGLNVGGSLGYWPAEFNPSRVVCVCICPICSKPSYFEGEAVQVPGPIFGDDVKHLPADIDGLYRDARNCMAIAAYTAGAMACRKILMNVAVSKGAEQNKSFKFYVEYLGQKGYVPPNGEGWVSHIRDKGNDAVHEIPPTSKDDLADLLTFLQGLLTFIFDFPARAPKKP